MNLIPKICEMLQLGIGEEFNLINTETKTLNITECTPTKYRLNNDCPTIIEYYIPSGDRWSRSGALFDILHGNLEIVKLPFKPKEEERYWFYYVGDDEIGTTHFSETNTNDLMRVYCGNCFHTEAEAQAHKQEIYEKLTGKKWIEVAE